jgi:hypothetical protein
MKLYQIPAALRAIEAQIEEAEGELTPEAEAALNSLGEEFARKAEYLALLTCEATAQADAVTAQADAVKAEADRLYRIATAHQNRAASLKAYVKRCMEELGEVKISGELATVAIQRNGQPSVGYEVPPEFLPARFQRLKIEADSKAITEAWKAGEEMPEGVTVQIGTHLRIR